MLLLVLVLAAALVTSHGVAVASLPRSIPAVCCKEKEKKQGARDVLHNHHPPPVDRTPPDF